MADATSVIHAPPAWRFAGPDAARRPSLAEVHASIPVPQGGIWLRRFLAFVGPGYMVAVGYMDPGNWATDIAGGARFGYALRRLSSGADWRRPILRGANQTRRVVPQDRRLCNAKHGPQLD
jgi:hypothetical protein